MLRDELFQMGHEKKVLREEHVMMSPFVRNKLQFKTSRSEIHVVASRGRNKHNIN
jgi:hypothetical protein